MKAESVVIALKQHETVSGILCRPDKKIAGKKPSLVIFAHGAANSMHEPTIVFLAEGLAHEGNITLRFNFPYSDKGKKTPDPQSTLESTWSSVIDFSKNREADVSEVIAVGKSMGGRVASQMIAAGNLMVNRLVLLGYPLHPPGKPDQRRDAHLHGITVPMLFFAGTRDPLCRLELLQPVLHALTAPWELEVIDGADHSFKLPKSSSLSEQQVYAKMLKRMVAWISGTQDNR